MKRGMKQNDRLKNLTQRYINISTMLKNIVKIVFDFENNDGPS